MFTFFSKKSEDTANKTQPDPAKSQLDAIQDSLTVLDKEEMVRVEGGKSGSKPFDQIFNWNSSCGGTIPQ